MRQELLKKGRIIRGDITRLACDAIVNAADFEEITLALFGEREFGFAREYYEEFR